MLFPEAEFARRGDHAVGDVSVGRARGDGERAGQHGAGERDDDLVAGDEIVGAADDAADVARRPVAEPFAELVAKPFAKPSGHADIHLTPVDGLAVRLRFGFERQHLTDDDRAGQLERVHGLLFEADLHERGMDRRGSRVGREVDVFAEPAEWDAHQTTIPNC